jgi:hypothetical protein
VPGSRRDDASGTVLSHSLTPDEGREPNLHVAPVTERLWQADRHWLAEKKTCGGPVHVARVKGAVPFGEGHNPLDWKAANLTRHFAGKFVGQSYKQAFYDYGTGIRAEDLVLPARL